MRPWTATALRAAAIVWSIATIVAHSDTGVPFPLWMLLAGSLLVILFLWVVAVCVVIALRINRHEPAPYPLRSWLAIPLPIVAALAVIWLALPLKARLFFSGPALRQSGAFLTSLPPSRFDQAPPWIGLFRVREFQQYGEELRFLTNDCGLVDRCGLVYFPGGPPPNRGEDTFEHLYAEWWHWHQSF